MIAGGSVGGGSGGSGGGGSGSGNICISPSNPTAESYFTFNSSNGTITDYDEINGPTDVVIPCTINGVAVVNIGDYAFFGGWDHENRQLTSVVMPDSIVSIGEYTF